MNITDTTAVLAKLAAFDQRTVGEADLAAWHEVVGHMELQDCLAAVTAHYREQAVRAMPADIRRLAITIRDQRKAGEHLALPAGPTVRDRSPEVTALVRQVAESLPSPDLHAKARERARNERGRPSPKLREPLRKERRKPPKDHPPPATDEAADMARRYLTDGHDPLAVSDRFGISRRWCQRAARDLDITPERAARHIATELHERIAAA